MKINQIFCNHDYKKIAYRVSSYTSDINNFIDLGCYNDELYKCSKCGKEKVKVVQNEKHPLYHEWKKVDDNGQA